MPEPEGEVICWNVRSRRSCSYSCLVVDMYQDLDRRGLQFLNENRPARRYMYFRHAIAHLHVQMENLPDLKKKLPSGTIWASSGKKDGYLRTSVLQSFAKRVGDEPLPLDSDNSWHFADTISETGKEVSDKIATVELFHRMAKRSRGVAESGEDLDDDDDDSNDHDNDDGDDVDGHRS